jgi:hypothetical protein
VCVGLVIALTRWGAVALTDRTKEAQLARYKTRYVQAVVRQDISWFDTSNPERLATVAGETMVAIENGLASKTWGIIEIRTSTWRSDPRSAMDAD